MRLHHILPILIVFLVISLTGTTSAQPNIEPTMADSLKDIDGTANPGDTLQYKVIIKNTGDTDGQNTQLSLPLDPNTALEVGSIQTTPIARDDGGFSVLPNPATLNESAPGVLGNDNDPDGSTPLEAVPQAAAATSEGGTITLNADGSFDYTPAVAFTGVDSFLYQAEDPDGNRNDATVYITVAAPPMLDLDSIAGGNDYNGAFTEDGGAVPVGNVGNITITDSDDTNMQSATITLTNPLDAPDDTLVVNGALPAGISVDGASTETTIILIGSASIAGYQTAIGQIEYDNSSNAPTETNRTISVVVNDGGSDSNTATATINVTAVNDPPTVVASPTESFETIGNTTFEYSAAQSVMPGVFLSGNLLSNFQADPDGPGALTVSGTSNVTAGASVTANADGTFSYTPPPGQSANDTFDYTVTDGASSVTRTVTISFTDMVWYVDNTAIAGGFGRSNDPFDTLAEAQTGSSAGETIFVFEGDGGTTGQNAGIILKNDQKLLGEGFGLSLNVGLNGNAAPTNLVSAGNHPLIGNGGGIGVTLAQNDTLRGVNIGATTGYGISGNAFGNLTISNVAVTGAGPVLDLTNGTVDAVFDNLGTTASTVIAIDLTNINGQLTANGGALTGLSGVGFNMDSSAATVTYNGSVTQNTAMSAVNLTNNTGSTITLAGTITANTSTATGFNATGGGTINVTGTGSSITTTTGTAVNITDTTIGANHITFESISVNAGGAATTAIILDDTGANEFRVTGTGSTGGSGGTIENITDADAITLNNTDGLVSLSNMIIQNISAASDGGDVIGTRSGVDGIHGAQVDGGLSLTNVVMDNFSDNAILGGTFASPPLETTWQGLRIVNCQITDSNRYHVANRGDDADEATIQIEGISGTVFVDNSTFERGAGFLNLTTASSGNLDMTVQRSSFNRTIKEFPTGGTVNVGKRGLSVMIQGSLDAVIRIGDPNEADSGLKNTFIDNASASIVISQFATTAASAVDVVVSQNDFIVNDHTTSQATPPSFAFNFPQGGVYYRSGLGTFNGILSHNLFDEVMNAAGGVGQFTMTSDDGGTSQIHVHDNTFQLPWNGPVRLLADGNVSSAVLFEDNTYVDGVVGGVGTDLDGVDGSADCPGDECNSPFLGFQVNVRNGGGMDLTLRNEDLPQQDDVNAGGDSNSFIADLQVSGTSFNLYLDNCKAPDGYDLTRSAGTFNLYRENGGDATAVDIIGGNGNTGGGGQARSSLGFIDGDNTSPPVVTTSGTITPSDTPPTLPSITIP